MRVAIFVVAGIVFKVHGTGGTGAVVDRSPDRFSRHFCVPVPIKYPLNPTFQGAAMLLTRAKNCAENAASCFDVGLLGD